MQYYRTILATLGYFLDLFPNARVAYSTQKLRSGYTGACVRIRRITDSAETDIGFNAQGNIDMDAVWAFAYRNIIGESERFGGGAWNGNGVNRFSDVISTTDPFGNNQASRVYETANNSEHVFFNDGTSLVLGEIYNFSIYLKKENIDWIQFSVHPNDTAGNPFVNVNLNTGVIGNVGGSLIDYGIQSAGGGWYRVWFTGRATITMTQGIRVIFTNNTNTASRNGASPYVGNINNSVYAFGAQITHGTTLYPYQSVRNNSTTLIGGTSRVVTWYDQSGNGHHATNATAGEQPFLTRDGFVRYSFKNNIYLGAIGGSRLVIPSYSASGALTLLSLANVSAFGGYSPIYTHGTVLTAGYHTFGLRATANLADWATGDQLAFGDGFGAGNAPRVVSDGAVPFDILVNSEKIHFLQLNNTDTDLFWNKQQVATKVKLNGTPASVTATGLLFSTTNVGERLNGNIHTVILYDTTSRSASRIKMIEKFAEKTNFFIGRSGDNRPLDAYSANCFAVYGLRTLLKTWTGALIRVRRNFDNVEKDFYADLNGELNQADLLEFARGGDLFVSRFYDQSGNNRIVQQTKANSQPYICLNGVLQTVNGKLQMNTSGNRGFVSPVSHTLGSQRSYVGQVNITNNAVVNSLVYQNGTPFEQFYSVNSPVGQMRYFSGSAINTSLTVAIANQIWSARSNGTSKQVWINNTANSTTLTGSSSSITNTLNILGYGSAPNQLTTGEIVVFDYNFEGADRNAIVAEMANYYGITL